jgi:hypothetical protein
MAIEVIKHHVFDRVEVTDEPITANAGLAALGLAYTHCRC